MLVSRPKAFFTAAFAALLWGAPVQGGEAPPHPGTGVTISVARPTWTTGWFQTEIFVQGLKSLGYAIEGPVALDVPVFYQALAQGDIDVWFDSAFPVHDPYLVEVGDAVEPVGYVVEGGGGSLEGYLIDKATSDRLQVTNLADFKRPEVKAAFDIDGDGRAEMVACPPGWGCELMIAHQWDAYGLRGHVDLIKAGYSSSMADLLARYQSGQSVFFYTWTPNWTVGVLKPGVDVVWIEVPFPALPDASKTHEADIAVPGVKGCVDDPCEMGYPENDIRAVANKAFLAENPPVRAFIEAVRIPEAALLHQNALMHAGEKRPEDIERHARAWIAENQAKMDQWLAAARAAAGQP